MAYNPYNAALGIYDNKLGWADAQAIGNTTGTSLAHQAALPCLFQGNADT